MGFRLKEAAYRIAGDRIEGDLEPPECELLGRQSVRSASPLTAA